MLRVVVDSRVRIELPEGPRGEMLAKELKVLFTHRNGKRIAMDRAGTRGRWTEPAFISTWGGSAVPGAVITLPRGGLRKVLDHLKSLGEGYAVEDCRMIVGCPDFPEHRLTLDPHQVRLVAAAVAKQNCILRSGTGSGKTTALLALAARLKQRALVAVHSNALLDQWVERAEIELGITTSDEAVGVLTTGKRTTGDLLTIGTTKSILAALERDASFGSKFGLVIADEVHLFAATSFMATVDPMLAKWRVGASDDARRKDKKEFLIYDVFGAEAESVSDAEVIACGRTMDVEVLIVPTEFRADWYGHPTAADPEKTPDYQRLVSEMAVDVDRNSVIDRIIAQELADGHQCLAFATEREHCRVLGAMAAARARSGFLVGGPDFKKTFQETKKGLKSGKIRVAVGTYQACGTGIDLPGVEVGIACTPCLGNRQRFRQARGRVCRAPSGKTVARLYVLFDEAIFGLSQVENALKWAGKNVHVLSGAEWVHAREWLRARRGEGQETRNG